jgi:lipopolysaccharide export system permease protein
LTIYEKALIRDIFKAFLLVMLILLIIVFAMKSVKILKEVTEGLLSTQIVVEMIGLEMIKVIGIIMPPAFFFCLVMVISSVISRL